MTNSIGAKKRGKMAPFFALALAVVFVSLYYILFFALDLAGRNRYGRADDGVVWLFKITTQQGWFYLANFLTMIPAALLAFALYRMGKKRINAGLAAAVRRPKVFALYLAVFAAIATAFWSGGVLSYTAVTDDEGAYMFSAKTYAMGKLAADRPPGARLFRNTFLIDHNKRIYSQFTAGHPAVLAIFYKLGSPYLLPVVASFAAVYLIFLLGSTMYDEKTGLVAAALLGASPFFIATGATLLAHLDCLVWLLAFCFFCARLLKAGSIANAAMAAFCFGVAFHVRSATALFVGGPFLVCVLYTLLGNLRTRWKELLAFTVVGGLFAAIYLWLNLYLNGDFFRTSYEQMWRDKTSASLLGFGRKLWGIHYTPGMAVAGTVMNWLKVNFWVFGWGLSLAPLLAWLILRPKQKRDLLFALPILFAVVFLFFYFWPGVSDTGPVLYYELLLCFTLLSARGLFALAEKFGSTKVACAVFSLMLVSFATFLPAQGVTMHRLAERCGEPERFVKSRVETPALVFASQPIKSAVKTKEDFQDSWRVGRPYNSPTFDDAIAWVAYSRPNKKMNPNIAFWKKFMPDRRAYVFSYDGGSAHLVELSP